MSFGKRNRDVSYYVNNILVNQTKGVDFSRPYIDSALGGTSRISIVKKKINEREI